MRAVAAPPGAAPPADDALMTRDEVAALLRVKPRQVARFGVPFRRIAKAVASHGIGRSARIRLRVDRKANGACISKTAMADVATALDEPSVGG